MISVVTGRSLMMTRLTRCSCPNRASVSGPSCKKSKRSLSCDTYDPRCAHHRAPSEVTRAADESLCGCAPSKGVDSLHEISADRLTEKTRDYTHVVHDMSVSRFFCTVDIRSSVTLHNGVRISCLAAAFRIKVSCQK